MGFYYNLYWIGAIGLLVPLAIHLWSQQKPKRRVISTVFLLEKLVISRSNTLHPENINLLVFRSLLLLLTLFLLASPFIDDSKSDSSPPIVLTWTDKSEINQLAENYIEQGYELLNKELAKEKLASTELKSPDSVYRVLYEVWQESQPDTVILYLPQRSISNLLLQSAWPFYLDIIVEEDVQVREFQQAEKSTSLIASIDESKSLRISRDYDGTTSYLIMDTVSRETVRSLSKDSTQKFSAKGPHPVNFIIDSSKYLNREWLMMKASLNSINELPWYSSIWKQESSERKSIYPDSTLNEQILFVEGSAVYPLESVAQFEPADQLLPISLLREPKIYDGKILPEHLINAHKITDNTNYLPGLTIFNKEINTFVYPQSTIGTDVSNLVYIIAILLVLGLLVEFFWSKKIYS